jgi:hypothetical protein
MDEILHLKRGDYYMDVREFESGGLEVCVKLIRPLPFSGAGGNNVRVTPKELSESEKKDNHDRAVRRAKKNIRMLAKSIGADRLLTLTYRKNQEDREEVKADFARFLRLVRKGWKGCQGQDGWRYVAVLERQERGAYHIHCAIKGWQRISYLRAAWYKALGGAGDESGENTPGNVDVTSPQKARWGTQRREWKTGKLAAYLTKYLSKTFDEGTSEKRRYWHSKDAFVPKKERFFLCAESMSEAIREVASILYFYYGQAIDFSRSWMSELGSTLWFSLDGEPVA